MPAMIEAIMSRQPSYADPSDVAVATPVPLERGDVVQVARTSFSVHKGRQGRVVNAHCPGRLSVLVAVWTDQGDVRTHFAPGELRRVY